VSGREREDEPVTRGKDEAVTGKDETVAGNEREAYAEAGRRMAEWTAAYRRRVAELPVLSRVAPGEVAAAIPPHAPERGEPFGEVLADLDRIIVPGLTHWNHPGFLAYFASSASPPAILAETAIAALGVNAMLWRTSPAATELEERMVGWLRDFVGLPAAFSGVLQDTASSATLTALLAARERVVPGVRRTGLAAATERGGPLTVYLSDQAHSSVHKAAIAAGIGLDQVRVIPSDAEFRLRPELLSEKIAEDRRAGCRPALACATLGTTSTTSVDPVAEIAEICAREGVWLHVDAAYAGPAASLLEKRELFRGWERADSIVLNPHKWMMVPLDCSALLFRDPDAFRASLALTPEYLRSEEGVTNLMEFGLPLGRRFRALKLWFLFRWYGAEGLRAKIRADIALAEEFAGWIATDARFELAAPHPFSVVCFRALPPAGHDEDEWNRDLLAGVNRRGPVFLSDTVLGGRRTLHLAVGGETTERRHVRQAYELLCEEFDRAFEAAEPLPEEDYRAGEQAGRVVGRSERAGRRSETRGTGERT